MNSEPQTFVWPGLAVDPAPVGEPVLTQPLDPGQAAADAATAGHQQGFDRGYAEGLVKGEQDAQAQLKQQLTSVQTVLTQAEAFAEQWRSAQVKLVQSIGAKFLLQELLADSDRLSKLLEQGQRLLPNFGDFSLACHPELEDQLTEQTRYALIADPQLPPGSLELRQGSSCLQFDMDAIVAQAFASLDLQPVALGESAPTLDQPMAGSEA